MRSTVHQLMLGMQLVVIFIDAISFFDQSVTPFDGKMSENFPESSWCPQIPLVVPSDGPNLRSILFTVKKIGDKLQILILEKVVLGKV